MAPAVPEFAPHSLEAEAAALWKARRLPPAGGTLGPPSGPTVHQFLGSWTQADFSGLVAYRAVMADVTARYLALSGRRVSGTLRQGPSAGPMPPRNVPSLLTSLGIWVGGDGRMPWDAELRPAQVQAMVARLAAKGVLVTRDDSFRVCPSCGTLRSPERTIYDEQEGDTYLVRFPVRVGDRTVHALVWVDVPWKLLGASALLVNPNLRYVVAEYRFREARELVLTSKSSLERLRKWIPEAVLEVLEERAGKEFEGLAYTYPLRHEFPIGGELSAPAGTLLAAADVGDSGTGIVPLVPGHGPTDARIAERLGVSGWPLLTPRARFDLTLMHKYAGLDLETANEFVLRDLSEAGALLAHLRVKRGVPHCVLCGTSLLWVPARAWCLEPSRLPPDLRRLFARLLPKDPLPGPSEVAPWPVSEGATSDDSNAVALLECKRCERLDAPDGPKQCACGGQRTLVRRRLLPSIGSALSAWARVDPLPDGDSALIYIGQRRRVASLLHHLVAMCGVEGSATDVTLTVVPTVATADVADFVAQYGADAVRAAVVRGGLSATTGSPFVDQCRHEFERLRRYWTAARAIVAACDPSMFSEFARPIDGLLGELEPEDRAILARSERTRVMALAHYDRSAPGIVYRRVTHFLDNDLVDYRQMVSPRLALAGDPPSKRGALRTLVHLLRSSAQILAPIAPFTMEAIHRSVSPARTSLFERTIPGPVRALENEELFAAWDRWQTVLRSVGRFRRSIGAARSTRLPLLVLSPPADDVADRFRAETELLARLTGVDRIEVGSPREPWKGRRRVLVPVEAEVQRVYPTQAKQIVHLLQRMTPKRAAEAAGDAELNVVIDGYPVRIYPAMISVVDTLPERVVPVPWSLGQMYVETPTDARVARPPFPPLSPDAFWLVRRLDRRLRSSPPPAGQPPRPAVVTVKEPLASELRAVAAPLAQVLGLSELRVVDRSEEQVPHLAITGRTRTGDRWWVHVPGLPAPPARSKKPLPLGRLPRVATPPPSALSEEVDFTDEKVVAREEAVRALGQELDDIVGLPLLGPSKVSAAWDQGLRSVDDLRHAPFDIVAALPGFGGPIAEVVIERIGGTPPPHRGRARQRRETPPRASRQLFDASLAPSPASEPASAVPETSSIPAVAPVASPTLAMPLPPPTEKPTVLPEPVAPTPVELMERPTAIASPDAIEAPELSPEPTPDESEAVPPSPMAPDVPSVESVELPSSENVPPAEMVIPPDEQAPELAPSSEAEPPTTEAAVPAVISSEPPVEPEMVESPLLESPASPLEAEPPSALPEVVPTETPLTPTEAPEIETSEPALVEEPEATTGGEESEATESPPAEALPTGFIAEPATPTLETAPSEPGLSPTETLPPAPVPTEQGAPPVESSESPSGAVPAEGVPVPTSETTPETAPAPTPPAEVGVSPPVETAPTAAPMVPEPEPAASETIAPAAGPAESEAPPAAAPAALPEPAPVIPAPPSGPEPEPSVPTIAPPVPPPSVPVPLAAPPPAPPPPEPEPALPPSGVELTVSDSLFAALGGFLDSTAAGHRGVCVVRESPERIRARVGPRPIEVFWLSNIGRGPSIRPADLEGLWSVLARKLTEEHATAFFLEGMEYLIRMHGADAVLTGLVQFDRLAREHDARIWVCLTPALMKPTDLERFRYTFGPGRSS